MFKNFFIKIKNTFKWEWAFLVAFFALTIIAAPTRSLAAQVTVCASGCTYTTISAALAAITDGDTIYVNAGYDNTGEVFSLSRNITGVTIDCRNSGAVIGIAGGGQKWLFMASGWTLQNCTFLNLRVIPNGSNDTVSGNTFSSDSSIHLTSAAQFNISNNININDIYINSSCPTGTIANNTFDLQAAGFSGGYPILFGFNTNGVTISSNTFHNHYAAFTNYIYGFGNDLTIASNTFDFAVNPTGAGVIHTAINVGGVKTKVTGNKILMPFADAGTGFVGIYVTPANTARNVDAVVDHNTIMFPKALSGTGAGPVGVRIDSTAAFSNTTEVNNNIILSTSTNPNSTGIYLSKGAATLTLTNDYNTLYQLNTSLSLNGGATASLGANTRTSDPFLETKDSSTANDLTTAPFSSLLNVNGGQYVGATAGPRRTTIYINPSGTIDYSAVDATSTQDAIDNLISGDTINLASGNYSAITIASTTQAVSNITLTGAGSNTQISGSAGASAITLQGLDSCTVSSLIAKDAGAAWGGITFVTSTNCTTSFVTSTNNGYGFWFRGGATGNSINDSVASLSVGYDVKTDSLGDNLIKNSNFSFVSSSFGGAGLGTLHTYFKIRAFLQDSLNAPVANTNVTLVDGNSSVTTVITSGSDGYTPFSDYLLAAVFSSGATATTSGGYNPYTVTASAAAGLSASSTSRNLDLRQQNITLTLLPSTVPPGIPTVSNATETTLQLTLDSAGNPANTEYTIYDSAHSVYINSNGSFVNGTQTWKTLANWGTPITLTDLPCNSVFSFVVKARSAGLVETATSSPGAGTTTACSSGPSNNVNIGGQGETKPKATSTVIVLPPPPEEKEFQVVTSTTSSEPIVIEPEPENLPEKAPIIKPPAIKKTEGGAVKTAVTNTLPVKEPEIIILATTTPDTNNAPTTTTSVTTTPITNTGSSNLLLSFIEFSNQAIKNFGQSLNNFKNSPQVQKAARERVAPITVSATAAGMLAFISWSDILPLLRYLFLQPIVILGQRKRRGWGQAYNSLNKLPVDLVTVRLIDVVSGRIVRTRVTDHMGRYAFIAPPGTYRLEAFKNSLVFPSQFLAGFSSDGRRPDIYHGEIINVTENDGLITANIPLDPSGENKRPRRLFLEKAFRTTQFVFSWLGLFITALSVFIAPLPHMYALLALHILLLAVFRRLALPPKIKSWGLVTDADSKEPLNRAVVRLFSTQLNKLVDTCVTDAKGRYYFLAGDNRYFVTFDHPNYTPAKSPVIDLTNKDAETITIEGSLTPKQPQTP